MNSEIELPRWIFHSSFGFSFLYMSLWVTSITLAIVLIPGWVFLNIPLVAAIAMTLLGLAVGLVVQAVLVSAAIAYYTITVRPDGIYGYSTGIRYHDQPWSDIAAIRPINCAGLKYIRLYSKTTSKVMWIPFFLTDFNRFLELAIEFTDSDNPLNQFARTRLNRKDANPNGQTQIRYIYH